MKTIDKIDKFLAKRLGLTTETKCYEKKINPKDLIVSKRIDLVAKLKYIECYENKYKTDFFKKIYKETISCFSDGTYNEPGNKEKNSIDSYIKSFNKMINDIKKNGFDDNKSLVPVSKNNVIFDGAHRTAVCAYFNKKVSTLVLPFQERNYDLSYFKRKCLEDKYLDYLCLEYSKLKNNIYVICIWPKCPEEYYEEIDNKIESSLKVVYKKEVNFGYDGLRNFVIRIYNNDNWIGSLDNNYKGVDRKVSNCFGKNNTKFYVVEESDFDKIKNLKSSIRKIVGIGNHSIHTSDNYEESLDILNMILNHNTINFLNNSKPYKYKKTIKEIEDIKKVLTNKKVSYDDVVLDGSVVLALYGLRENRDIDFIVKETEVNKVKKELDIHNNELDMYDKTVDDIIYNPDNYFYFSGLKYESIELLKLKKEKRGEKKDKRDIELINTVLVKKSFIKRVLLNIKRKMIKLKLRIKYYTMKILIVTHLDKPFKKVWRKIKKKK